MERSSEPALSRELASLVTEGVLPESAGLDTLGTRAILDVIHAQDRGVPAAVGACLDEIVGRRTSEDVLRHIFERFCIGK